MGSLKYGVPLRKRGQFWSEYGEFLETEKKKIKAPKLSGSSEMLHSSHFMLLSLRPHL